MKIFYISLKINDKRRPLYIHNSLIKQTFKIYLHLQDFFSISS